MAEDRYMGQGGPGSADRGGTARASSCTSSAVTASIFSITSSGVLISP